MRAIRTTLTLCLAALLLVACGLTETPEEARSREHREFIAAMNADNARLEARVESLKACSAAMRAATEYFRADGGPDTRLTSGAADAFRIARRGNDDDVTAAITDLYGAVLQDDINEVLSASSKVQRACAALQERSQAETDRFYGR